MRALLSAALILAALPATARDRALTLGPAICHVSVPAASGVPLTLAGWAKDARLFQGLGTRTRRVSTASAAAQAYFDQGMRWLWAFNHDEATRSFAKAAMLDPGCAMCFWGAALTVGPNYNLGVMTGQRAQVAYNATRQAVALSLHATPVERALIAALAVRYPNNAALDDAGFEKVQTAYAGAMRTVAHRFPDDLDVQTLAAEALMTAHAWKLWTLNGTPAAGTEEVLALLRRVMAKDPSHPGADHYYIHAMEASPHPELAVPAAEHLIGAMPAAGHLDHMPSHIFQRVGRYEESAAANRVGAAADLAYFKQVAPPDYYATYTVHNFQFEALGAAMEGRLGEALRAMDGAEASISPEDKKGGLGWLQGQRYAYLVQFGRWQQMLDQPPPDAKYRGLTVAWLWARGTAQAATGQIAAAQESLARLEALAKSIGAKDAAGLNSVSTVHGICLHLLRARLARSANQTALELAELRQAVAAEDKLNYSEPPDWFTPTRQTLGAALLRAGQPAEAERIYREDLVRTPENGFSLLGLAQALQAQGKPNAAELARFQKAWARADTQITASAS